MVRVEVNSIQCQAIGKVLQGLTLKASAGAREFITFESDLETKLRAYLFSVGICHQTHTLINKKLNLVGFNYLEKVFVDLARTHSELLEPSFIAEQTPQGLSLRLAPLFSDTGSTDDSTLDRLTQRSELLIDMSQKLLAKHSGHISTLLATSGGYLGGDLGIYQLLSHFEAYSDPFRKKSSLFVILAQSAGLLSTQDMHNAIPIMDYHIQRVLLRFGCVEILDLALRHALINQEKIGSDEEIRRASIEATQQLAFYSGHPVEAIHDFLWPLGRSCCKENPLCTSGVCDKNPCTLTLFVNLSSHKKCEFEGVCKGSLSADYIRLWQPIVETHYY